MSPLQLKRRPHKHRLDLSRPNVLYGYGYRPDWPSILSVAHDEDNGGRIFIITDRPCMISDAYPPDAPLEMPGFPAVLLAQEALSPSKFALTYDLPIPRGNAWRWPENRSQIRDPLTGCGLNAGGGTIDDFPGPYVPLPGASVVYPSAMGYACQMTFDRRIALQPGAAVDDAFTFDGAAPTSVMQLENVTLAFELSSPVSAGSSWQLSRQPAWLFTPATVPQGGVF